MDISQTQGKRKRETKAPRITYHAATRTFDRLFKEESLDETKDVVRKKLGLPDSSNIRLAQIRGDHTVDLEDEDDFDAFYAVAHSKMAIEVEVTIEDMPSPRHNPSLSLAVINQKAPSPTVLNDHIASPSEVPTGDEVRMARKDTFLGTPSSQNLPPKKHRPSTPSISGPSAAKESQSTNTALPQTELAADVTDPTPQPKKRKRKTEEKETSAKILPSAQNADESGSKPKPTKRAKKITEKETNDDSTTSQQPIKSTSTLTTKPNGQTLPDTFSQQLAQSITDGHLASTVPEDASTAPKRTKRRNSVAGQTAKAKASEKLTDVKAKVDKPVPNGELEATEQPTDGKSKPKKKKKEERVVTPAELEAVRGDMSQVVASLARELVGMVTTQPSQATTGSQKKPLTAKEILAAAKNKNTDRTRSPIANIVDAESAAPKKKSGSTQSKILSSSSSDGESTRVSAPHPIPHPNSIPNIQNLDDIDSGTYLEELLGGPRQQRLTLDSILPFVASTSKKRKAVVLEEDPIIKTKAVRHSAHTRSQTWASSDSDPDYDSTSDNVEMVSSSVRVIDQPPALKTSNKDSVVINSDTNPRPPEVAVSSITSTLHGQTSPVGTAVRQTISEIPLEIHHPVIMDRPTPIAAPSIQQHTTPSDTSVAENDPIETIIPSPRSNSPIEIAPVASTSLPSARTPTNTIMYLKPEVVITRRSTRKTNSQPISKHEADIRPSVVKLTRTRSQSAVQRKNQTAPPPSPPQSPRRLRSSTQVDPTTDSLVGQTPVTVQANRSEASETMWTTLNVGPSSTGDAASSHGSDELQSSPDLDPDSPPAQSHSEAEAPLFIASESQVDFPYSQFQNLDADTDNGANAPTNVSRLEEDSEEEVEVQKTITPRAPTARGSATYRGLSEIASQNKFFTGLQHHLATSSTPKDSKEDMYGPLSQAYDDDASDSGSESEVEKSHIPRARRAGIKR